MQRHSVTWIPFPERFERQLHWFAIHHQGPLRGLQHLSNRAPLSPSVTGGQRASLEEGLAFEPQRFIPGKGYLLAGPGHSSLLSTQRADHTARAAWLHRQN